MSVTDNYSKSKQSYRYNAFISYNHKDKLFVERFFHRIKKHPSRFLTFSPNLIFFIDHTEIRPNDKLKKKIHQHLDSSNYLILMASHNSAEAEWVDDEVSYWIEIHNNNIKNLIVVFIGDTNIPPEPHETLLPPCLRERDITERFCPCFPNNAFTSKFSLNNDENQKLDSISALLRGTTVNDIRRERIREQRRLIFGGLCIVTVLVTFSAYTWDAQIAATQDRIKAEKEAKSVAIISRTRRQEISLAPRRSRIHAIGFNQRGLVITDDQSNKLHMVAATGNSVTSVPTQCQRPPSVILGASELWVLCTETQGKLYQWGFSGSETNITGPISVGRKPASPIADKQSILIPSQDGILWQVKKKNLTLVRQFDVSRGILDIEFTRASDSWSSNSLTNNPQTNDPWVNAAWTLNRDENLVFVLRLIDGQMLRRMVPSKELSSSLSVIGNTAWISNTQATHILHTDENTPHITLPISGAFGFHNHNNLVWTYGRRQSALMAIDRDSGNQHTAINISSQPQWLRIFNGKLWVLSTDGELTRVSLDPPFATQSISLNIAANTLLPLSDGEKLWLVDPSNNTIQVVNQTSVQHQFGLSHCKKPSTPHFDGTNIWLACQLGHEAIRIPAFITVLNVQPSLEEKTAPIVDGPLVWTLHEAGNRAIVVNSYDQRVLAEVHLPAAPIDLVIADSGMWVICADGSMLLVNRSVVVDMLKEEYPQALDSKNDTNLIVKTIKISQRITSVVSNQTRMWLRHPGTLSTSTITIVDKHSGKKVRRIPVAAATPKIILDDTIAYMLHASLGGASLSKLDATDGILLSEKPLEHSMSAPVFDGEDIFLASWFPANAINVLKRPGIFLGKRLSFSPRLFRAWRGSIDITDEYQFSKGVLRHLTVSKNHTWAIHSERLPDLNMFGGNPNSKLIALDRTNLEFAKKWQGCKTFGPPLAYGALLWVHCFSPDKHSGITLWTIDTVTLKKKQTHHVHGIKPLPLQGHENQVWAVYRDTGLAVVFDAATGEKLGIYGLGQLPTALTFDQAGSFWVYNEGDSSLQKGKICKSWTNGRCNLP